MLELFDGIEIHRFIVDGDNYCNTADVKDFDLAHYFDSKIIYSELREAQGLPVKCLCNFAGSE